MLQQDIVTNYYYQRGAIENSLADDNQVQEAFKLLGDQERYKQILQPTK